MVDDLMFLTAHIRDIADWPRPGVIFKDITPLLADGPAFAASIDALAEHFASLGVDTVVGVEARGFLFAAPVAHALGVGLIPVRKPGKLPWEIEQQEYALEYGTDRLEMHRDAVGRGQRVAVIDDVLATGGTAAATVRLVERAGAVVVGLGFAAELTFLQGRLALDGHDVMSLVSYD